MITVLNVSLVSKVCPDNMKESTCPLHAFMKTQNVLRPTVNNSLFELNKPYPEIREEYIQTMDKIYQICNKCMAR